MAEKRDYYEVLGVARTASGDEIATAYRKLAIKYHPDSNPGDENAIALFKEAAEAYEVLSDSGKRDRYDRFGHAGVDGAGGGAHYSNVEDIFEAFGDIFGGGIFGDMFGGGRRSRRGPRKGADVKAEVELTLEEAAAGVAREVRFHRSRLCDTCQGSGARPGSHPETCQRCGGRGQVVQSAGFVRVQTACPTCGGHGKVITDPCQECRGGGYVADEVRLEVKIPPGVDTGMRIRVPGEGEPSPEGGRAGDLYCFVNVQEHSLFVRDGDHLILEMPITFAQAALGAEIDVPTLQGKSTLTIPRSTQTGDVFRLSGLGLSDPRGGRPGDQLVRVWIEVPKKLTRRQEELLRELAEEENHHVSPKRKSFLEKIRDYFVATDDELEESEAAAER
jgi:molecular chaperone DnaJ